MKSSLARFSHGAHSLTADTRGIINARAFSMMKRGVRFINCARGGLIDERALLRRFKEAWSRARR